MSNQHTSRLTWSTSYEFHSNNSTNTTNPWSSSGREVRGTDDNISTIIVIATLLFMLAITPIILSLLQKHCAKENDPQASDGNTVTLENDKTNDLEMNSVMEDISQKSAPRSLHSLHDSSVKGRRSIFAAAESGAPSSSP
mmetsp:Transcript_4016/g.8050  ORF Transcript_4016/g.8050 Transcript_4016/m.8050 type:complete len:140 (+) Transcript_4016:109-528(+)|eukprot:scaffold43486_cov183-Amphora_coffeaeformis.AAC.3